MKKLKIEIELEKKVSISDIKKLIDIISFALNNNQKAIPIIKTLKFNISENVERKILKGDIF